MSANDIEYKNIDFEFHLRSCLSKTLSCYIELSAHLLHSGWSLCVLQEVGWPDTALSHMTTNKLGEKKIIPVTELEWTTTKNWGKRDGQQQSRNPTALGSWKGCCRESFCCQKAWVYLKNSLHIHALFFWFSPLNSFFSWFWSIWFIFFWWLSCWQMCCETNGRGSPHQCRSSDSSEIKSKSSN